MNDGQLLAFKTRCISSARGVQVLAQEKMFCHTEEDTWLGCPSGVEVSVVIKVGAPTSILLNVAHLCKLFKIVNWTEFRQILHGCIFIHYRRYTLCRRL